MPAAASVSIDSGAHDRHARRLGKMRYILLLIPCLMAVAVPFYNFDEPRLLGFPFFYWALFLQVPISALFVYAVFRMDRAKGQA